MASFSSERVLHVLFRERYGKSLVHGAALQHSHVFTLINSAITLSRVALLKRAYVTDATAVKIWRKKLIRQSRARKKEKDIFITLASRVFIFYFYFYLYFSFPLFYNLLTVVQRYIYFARRSTYRSFRVKFKILPIGDNDFREFVTNKKKIAANYAFVRGKLCGNPSRFCSRRNTVSPFFSIIITGVNVSDKRKRGGNSFRRR